jgi:hypothetical protein
MVTTLAIAPDGRHALIGSDDGWARLWDLETGDLIRLLGGSGHPVLAIAIAPDGRHALTASTDKTTRLWDLETGKSIRSLEGHSHRVFAVAITPDGRHTLTGSWDGTATLWDLKEGRERCRFLSFDDGTWAVVDPKGRFDASNGGDVDGLHWVVGMEPIDLVQLRERYFDPGLLAKHMGLSKEPLRSVESFSGVKLYPSVEVAAPAVGDPKDTLIITLTDRGGGIGKVVVKINGKEVTADARGTAPDTDPRPEVMHLAVPLVGDPRLVSGVANQIEVQVYNSDGSLRSRGARAVYKAGGSPAAAPPELWAVVVGTADYIGSEIDLRFAAKDAEAFSAALAVAAGRLLGPARVHVRTLSTARPVAADRPTKANIEAAFRAVAAGARPTDLLVVYLSGHGVAPPDSDEYYYLTADARSLDLSDPEVRRRDAVSAAELAELIRTVPAVGRQVLVLDTCAAGRGIEVLGQRRAVLGDQARALERVKDRNGLHLLAGAAADAASYEASRYGQGLLTYALLLGMTGPGLKDTELDALTWFGYAVDEVPQLARGIGGVQRPLLSSPRGGASFPVGRLEPEDRRRIPLLVARPLVLRTNLMEEEADDDVLNLGGRVDEALRGASAKGDGAGPVFVDQREGGEGAYRLAGRYRLAGDDVVVRAQVRRGGERVGMVEVRGSRADIDGLARQLVAQANRLLKP